MAMVEQMEDAPMSDLDAIELKAFLPAKDFDLSKQFYQDLGFTLCWEEEAVAYLHHGDHGSHGKAGFLLQRLYVKEFAENLMMHLIVKDVDAWWASIQGRKIMEKYGVRAEPPEDRPWKMRDLILVDPSGVLWRIAQDTP
jgi:catechol 2,3-dioxygenase-like lactoylglutathione lyase family enzyme